MKRFLVLAFLILTPFMVYLGCGPSNSPTTPGGVANTATPTGTLVPSYTFTITSTPGSPTNTPTITETPYCVSPFSFGKNSIGTGTSEFSASFCFASHYSLSAAGKITLLHAYIPSSYGEQIQMAVYTDNAGAPQSLISQSNPQVSVTGWNTVNIPDTAVLPIGTYWIALTADHAVSLSYNTGSGGDGEFGSMGFGSFPIVYPGSGLNTYAFSFYADYCVVAGSPTPVPTNTFTSTATSTPTLTITNTQTPACSTLYSFGRNFAQGFSIGIDNGSRASRYTLPVAGIVTQLNAYVVTTNSANIVMGIYSNVSNAPGTLISGSNAQAAVVGVNTLAVPGTPLLPAGTYWIALAHDVGGTGAVISESTNDATDGSSTFSVIPSPNFGGSGPTSDSLSLWADYCVPGASPTPALTATWTMTPSFTPTPTITNTDTPIPSCNGSYSFGRNYLQAQSIGIDNGSRASKYVLTVAGIVNQLHVYVVTTNSANIVMGIYSNVSNAPGTLIAASAIQAAVVGVNNLTIPTTSLPAGTYWIALAHDVGGTGAVISESTNDATDGSSTFSVVPASPFGGSGPTSDSLSLWADYCVLGGSPTPALTATWTFTPVPPTATFTETPIPGCTPGTAGVTVAQSPSGGNNYFHSSKFTLATSKKIVGLHCYTFAAGGTFQMAIYNDNAGTPNTLLTSSSPQTAISGWNNVSIPGTGSLAAGTYWIATICNSVDFGYNTSGPAGSGYFIFSGTVGYPFPNPPSGGSSTTNIFSFYVDTCP